jgi:hypothetical protein
MTILGDLMSDSGDSGVLRGSSGGTLTTEHLDAQLLKVFKGFNRDLITIVVMAVASVFVIAFLFFVGFYLVFLAIIYGAGLFLFNVWRTVNLFRLIEQYRGVLALSGVNSTPIFERALAARTKLSFAWGVVLLILGWALVALFRWTAPGTVL